MTAPAARSGPLAGYTVIELAGIGPGPFTAMVLSDMGAEVVRVDRRPTGAEQEHQVAQEDLLQRGRRSVLIDLKKPDGVRAVLRMIDRADVLIDPYRPGVTERLGIGPDVCANRNPGLVYGRMTGWGQSGPLAHAAGHDINYLALAGPLAAIGRRIGPPPPPLNLVGDFGGGAMPFAFGILAALLERTRSGTGQVIDAAMVDGIALLSTSIIAMANMGAWRDGRESNIVDGGAHFYDTYETKDGRYVSIGPIEPKFYAEFLERLDLDPQEWPQADRHRWPGLSRRLAAIFRTRTRNEWNAALEGTGACYAPVLTFEEAAGHPHLAARRTFVDAFGTRQPAPAPRFSRTPGRIQGPPCVPGEHSRAVLLDWGFTELEVDELEAAGITETRTR